MSEAMTVRFFDTTLRDGAQALPAEHQFPAGSKPEIASAIASMGVHTIEAGFPATSADTAEVTEVAKIVGNTDFTVWPHSVVGNALVDDEPYMFTPVITGLARAVHTDIDATWGAVQYARNPGIHTFVATADSHIAAKHPGMNRDDVYAMAMKGIQHACEISTPNTVVEFSCEAATGTDIDYLERMVRGAVQQGANVINLPDTLGQASNRRITRMFAAATRWIIEEGMQDSITISAHNHEDTSRGVANTIAAMHAVEDTAILMGVTPPKFQAEVTVGGLGERSGNTRIDATVLAMMLDADDGDFNQYPQTAIDTRRMIPVAEYVFRQAGLVIPSRAPVVGIDSRTHRSGIHAHGVLAGGAHIYSPYDPRWFGANESAFIDDGKYQGQHGRNHVGSVAAY